MQTSHASSLISRRRTFRETVAAAALATFCSFSAGHAAELVPAAIEAQPLTYVRDGHVQGCGLRLTGGWPANPASSWFDVSLNIFQRGVGLAQSIAYEVRRTETPGDSRAAVVPIQRTWVKPGEGSARLGENSERRNTLIYRLLVDDVLALFEAIANEQPITLGVRPWGQREDAVFTGTALLTDESRQTMGNCLAALKMP